MKICIITPKAYPLFNPEIKSTFGGAEVQLSLLARELGKRPDLDIHLMVADYGQTPVEKYDGITIWKTFNFRDNVLKQAFDFFNIFNQINAEVYIQRTLTAQSGLIAFYCKLRRKTFVYMVAHDREVDGTHETYKNLSGRLLAQVNFRLARKIIVQNLYQSNKLPFRSSILYSSINIKDSLPQTEDRKYVLWVGRSENWKRPELLLQLAQEFPEETFVMICPPATNAPQLAVDIKNKASILKNVAFIDFVPFNEIEIYFEKAKVFVNTSTKEGFPNTFLQAAVNGVPILSLNVNPNGFLDQYKCGFYCGDDISLLKQRLNEMLKNAVLCKELGENAYRYVELNHNIKTNAQKLLEIISK